MGKYAVTCMRSFIVVIDEPSPEEAKNTATRLFPDEQIISVVKAYEKRKE